MLPISRGGRYTSPNVGPACASSTRASAVAEESPTWMRRRGWTSRRLLVQQVTIRRALTADGAQ